MGHCIFRFGSLLMGSVAQNFPQQPTSCGDIPQYDGVSSIVIGLTVPKMVITWVKPDGCNFLIADRVLLAGVSWMDLAKNKFVNGQEIILRGHRFRCRLPQVGEQPEDTNEWDKILDITGRDDALWHWKDMEFWGGDSCSVFMGRRVLRGGGSADAIKTHAASYRTKLAGFRPVLDIMSANWAIKTKLCIRWSRFYRNFIFDDEGVCPTLQSTGLAFEGIPNEEKVRMYTLTENGRPIHPHGTWKSREHLCLTDKYFGDEYLIPWTISNGMAVADIKIQKE